jgi:tRNA dimethylallyltransferase
VFEATGRPLSEWQQEMSEPLLANMNVARFIISPPRDVLHQRINHRFDQMMAAGAIEEAMALENPSPTAAKILGLRELRAAAEDTLPLEEAVEQAKARTRQYAKRQMTWFRHRMADWNWAEAQDLSNILPLLMDAAV